MSREFEGTEQTACTCAMNSALPEFDGTAARTDQIRPAVDVECPSCSKSTVALIALPAPVVRCECGREFMLVAAESRRAILAKRPL